MQTRVELQARLESILGSRNVYFQPPASIQLQYPCIIYTRASVKPVPADNIKYQHHIRYTVTLIDKNPDSQFLMPLYELPFCSFDRHYVADNLNHDVFSLYW